MTRIRLVPLVLLALAVQGCFNSNPPVLRRTALLLADEVDAGIAAWEAKLEAERRYYRDTQKLLRDSARDAAKLELTTAGILRRDAFVDQLVVDKKGVPLSLIREHLAAHNKEAAQAEAVLAARQQEAEQKAALKVAQIGQSRSELEQAAAELREIARESGSSSRDRVAKEWMQKYRSDAEKAGVKDVIRGGRK